MCMVYRPRPARMVTLTPASWLMLQACAGDTAAEIETLLAQTLAAKGRAMTADAIRSGLGELVALSLVRVDPARVEQPTADKER